MIEEKEEQEKKEEILHVPNDDNNIKYVFPIIHENHIEKNGVFKQYLCDILDKKYTHHIFNTYLYFNQKILGFDIKGYFTFFILLTLKPNWITISYFNDLYKELSNDNDKENKYNFDVEMSEIINLFINIFENPEDAIKKGSNHTNQEIIDLFIETNIIHLPVFEPSDLLKGQNVEYIMNYYKNVLMQKLYEKIGKYEKKQDTPISTVEPETFVVPGTIVEPVVVPGTIVNENTKQNSEEFEDAISEGKKYTGTIKGHRGCRTRRRGCKGSRHRRVGGKYTKRISNKGKSPVRQTKRIKLKRKTHKRRPI